MEGWREGGEGGREGGREGASAQGKCVCVCPYLSLHSLQVL